MNVLVLLLFYHYSLQFLAKETKATKRLRLEVKRTPQQQVFTMPILKFSMPMVKFSIFKNMFRSGTRIQRHTRLDLLTSRLSKNRFA